MTEHSDARPHSPVWLFGLLQIPFGISGAFASTTLPRILSLHHVDNLTIAGAVSASVSIAGWQFLWAPVVDLGVRRRTWFLLLSFLAASLMAFALTMPLPDFAHANADKAPLKLFIGMVLLSQAAGSLLSACIGGLMATTLPDDVRGKASGFSNAGNLGAGAVGAGIALQLLETQALPIVGAACGAMMAIPALVVLFVPEAKPQKKHLATHFRAMMKDIWGTIRAREGWTGILLCLSPVGTAAAMQLFSGVADAYHASPRTVTLVNGYVGGILTGVACIIGGYVCDRMNRRVAYLASGVLTAAAALLMAFAPMTEATYTWGALLYLFVSGFCYAAFTSVVLEIIGKASATASTQYTLFSAAGNQAIAYVVLAEGFSQDFFKNHFGAAVAPRGLLFADAALNIVGVGLFMLLLRFLRPAAGSSSTTPVAA